jgi:hypothetical protein
MRWVVNSIVALGATALLAVGLFLAIRDHTSSAATALGFGFLLVVLLLLAKFRRFKGFGFEAEMWEEKQAEAEDLIERLKTFSRAMVQQMAVYTSNMGLMDMGTVTIRRFEENLAQLLAILRQVEPDKSRDAELLEPLIQRIIRACCSQASQAVDIALTYELARLKEDPVNPRDQGARSDLLERLTKLQQEHVSQRSRYHDTHYIDSLRRLMRDAPLPRVELEELMRKLDVMDEELRYFAANNTFRRHQRDKDYPWR